MHCMLMDLLHGFEVLGTTEETLFNSRKLFYLVHKDDEKLQQQQTVPAQKCHGRNLAKLSRESTIHLREMQQVQNSN